MGVRMMMESSYSPMFGHDDNAAKQLVVIMACYVLIYNRVINSCQTFCPSLKSTVTVLTGRYYFDQQPFNVFAIFCSAGSWLCIFILVPAIDQLCITSSAIAEPTAPLTNAGRK